MVGIITYGVYIPRYRIKVEEIARVWGANAKDITGGLGVFEKSVPDLDEDTATIAVEAARNALKQERQSRQHWRRVRGQRIAPLRSKTNSLHGGGGDRRNAPHDRSRLTSLPAKQELPQYRPAWGL